MSLRIVKDSEVNRISPEIREYLDKNPLKPGEKATYRLLTGVKNVDKEKSDGQVLFPASQAIPLTDKIYDPGANDGKGGIVTIGVIRDIDRDGNIQFSKHYVHLLKNEGTFRLRGSVTADIEMYEVIELLNVNKNNPFRAEGVTPLFERIDDAAEAKARSTRRNFLFDALQAIKGWDYDELRVIGAAYNIPTTLDKDIIKDQLEVIAERAPEEFYKKIDSEEMKVKSIIRIAKEANIIGYNGHEQKWFLVQSGETLALLNRKEGVDENDQFAQVLISGINGPAMRGKIQKLISAKKKP